MKSKQSFEFRFVLYVKNFLFFYLMGENFLFQYVNQYNNTSYSILVQFFVPVILAKFQLNFGLSNYTFIY